MSTSPAAAGPSGRPAHANAHAHMPHWAVLAIACAAQFMVILDVSIVNVALPSMRTSLGLSTTGLQWVVNAYTLAFAGFLLFGGRAADLFGRKLIFLIGLGIFTGASLFGGLAQNEAWITIARAVQGLGGAILAPSTLSLLTTTYTEPRERARALGVWGAVAGSGGAFGAIAGGLLTDYLSWRWVLFVNIPIGVVLFVAAVVALTESRGGLRGLRSLDVPGTVTVTAALAVLVYGIVSTDTYAWSSAHTIVALVVAAVLLAVFLYVETHTELPMVPLGIFRLRSLSAANAVAMGVGAAMFSMFFFLSLYLQLVLRYSPLKAGVAFLPTGFSIIGAAAVASRLVPRWGARRPLLVGTALATAGLGWLSAVPAHSAYATSVLGPEILLGVGLGFCFVPLTIAATAGVEMRQQGLASGLINTSRQIGGAIGLAALATVATTRTADVLGALHARPTAADLGRALTDGYSRAFLVAAAIALVSAGLALTLPAARRRRGRHARTGAAPAGGTGAGRPVLADVPAAGAAAADPSARGPAPDGTAAGRPASPAPAPAASTSSPRDA